MSALPHGLLPTKGDPMNPVLYTRYEVRRAFRNRGFLLFALGFPLVLYFIIAAPNKGVHDFGGSGISAPVYYMVGLASFGTMAAMISTGGRIAGERQAGWTRQLRITPLSPLAYMRAKLLTAYAMAFLSMARLYVSGTALSVSLPAHTWLVMTGLIVLALLPFAALGVFIGHLLSVDAVGPVNGGLVSLLALVSGTWFPVTHGFLHDVGQFLPSYWLVQAGRVAEHGHAWTATGWVVVLGWAVVLTVLARIAYRRDTERV
ncbi:MAG: ABC transporter permease [Solirubrobacteraceae bacterium]